MGSTMRYILQNIRVFLEKFSRDILKNHEQVYCMYSRSVEMILSQIALSPENMTACKPGDILSSFSSFFLQSIIQFKLNIHILDLHENKGTTQIGKLFFNRNFLHELWLQSIFQYYLKAH